jgi:hypothetical protein
VCERKPKIPDEILIVLVEKKVKIRMKQILLF